LISRDAVGGLLQASDPIPQGLQILIIERELPNVFVEFDGFPEPVPCLRYPAAHAGVAGKVESDSGILGMNRLRPQQNGFRYLKAIGASRRIGQIDPPTCGSGINIARIQPG
jgi:hypothetical protein